MGKHRRIIVKVAVLLFAGAIINAAVAYLCYLDMPDGRATNNDDPLSEYQVREVWQSHATAEWTMPDEFHQAIDRRLVTTYRTISGRKQRDNGWTLYNLNGWELGIPFRCVWIVQWSVGFSNSAMFGPGYPRIPPESQTILWPGFAINTISYAAIVWILFTVPGVAVRRRVRRKRGQCAACGYSLPRHDR